MLKDMISQSLGLYPLQNNDLLEIDNDMNWIKENTDSNVSGENNSFFGKTHTLEARKLISKKQLGNKKRLGKYHNKATKEKISTSTINRFEDQNERDKISNSLKGRKLSKETKIKMSLSRKGRTFSEEHRIKIAESNKQAKKIQCTHCGKWMQTGLHNRWHGNNCKKANG